MSSAINNPDLLQEPITRADIRNKFAEFTGGLEETAAQAKAPLLGGGAVLVVALLVLAYWLGRRKGRAGRTVVEVRRV